MVVAALDQAHDLFQGRPQPDPVRRIDGQAREGHAAAVVKVRIRVFESHHLDRLSEALQAVAGLAGLGMPQLVPGRGERRIAQASGAGVMRMDVGNAWYEIVEAQDPVPSLHRMCLHADRVDGICPDASGSATAGDGAAQRRQRSSSPALPADSGLGSVRWRAAMSHLRIFRGHCRPIIPSAILADAWSQGRQVMNMNVISEKD
jgi:hypothetical protein